MALMVNSNKITSDWIEALSQLECSKTRLGDQRQRLASRQFSPLLLTNHFGVKILHQRGQGLSKLISISNRLEECRRPLPFCLSSSNSVPSSRHPWTLASRLPLLLNKLNKLVLQEIQLFRQVSDLSLRVPQVDFRLDIRQALMLRRPRALTLRTTMVTVSRTRHSNSSSITIKCINTWCRIWQSLNHLYKLQLGSAYLH
jgi:hypothetical protein